MKRLVVSALAALAVSAVSAATALFPGRVTAPAKVVMVDAVSTNASATVQLKRVTTFRIPTVTHQTVVYTNGWLEAVGSDPVPVLATNLVRNVAWTVRPVTNSVLTASCSGGVLSTNVSFAVFAGDDVLQLGTAESVRMLAE
jgi:hypothetical protein